MPNPDGEFSDLTALFINTTLTRSPAASHTQLLIDVSADIMSQQGVTVDQFRAVDHRIATGVYPDMRDRGWDVDEWPELFPRVLAADILVIGGPIWLGDNSSETKKIIERLYAHSGELNDMGQWIYYGRAGGCLITGNEDGIKHCTSNDTDRSGPVFGVLDGVQPLDDLLRLTAVVAQPDRSADHQDVRRQHPWKQVRPLVDVPTPGAHVRVDTGGDPMVDRSELVDADTLPGHDLRAHVDEQLSVTGSRRSGQRRVDEQRFEVSEVIRLIRHTNSLESVRKMFVVVTVPGVNCANYTKKCVVGRSSNSPPK